MKKGLFAAALVATAAVMVPVAAYAGDDTAITTKSGALGAPEAGKGQVVFFRPGSLMGAALGCTVHEGDSEVARLGSGKYYVIQTTPGTHSYFTEGEVTDKLTMEVEEGETYFVKCNIGMGVVAGRANLSPSDRDTFAKKAKGLKMWEPKSDKDDAKAD